MTNPNIRERHGLILEEYLSTCGYHRRELLKQNGNIFFNLISGVIDQLLSVAMKVKKIKKSNEQKEFLQKEV
jgi:hypothetical protein